LLFHQLAFDVHGDTVEFQKQNTPTEIVIHLILHSLGLRLGCVNVILADFPLASGPQAQGSVVNYHF